MKITRLLVFAITNLLVLNVGVCPLFATVPTTPKILFTSTRDGNRDVFIMNPDGSEQMNLTQHRADDQQAVWSPTGEKILFISDRGGMRDLYLMDTDGTNVQRFFKRKTKIERFTSTWSPDGKQIAYEQVDWGTLEFTLHIVTLGEQEAQYIADGVSPAWSPDRTKIAYTVEGRLTFIDVRTGEQRQLLPRKEGFWQRYPSWSTSGEKLVFSFNNNPLPPLLPDGRVPNAWTEKETIYIINRDGTGLQQLVEEVGSKATSPKLSPNGEEVLYTQKIDGRLQIFKLDLNSGIRTQLTHLGMLGLANSGGDWFDPTYALPVTPQPELLTTTWGEVKTQK